MQSDTTFIPDSYLSIGARISDVSTWANITELLIECQRRSRKKILAPPQRGEAEDQIQSACAVLVSMSCYHSQFGLSAFLSQHTPPLPSHPIPSDMETASCDSTLLKLRGTLICPQHATVSTRAPFTGHFSWLLKSLTFSSLPSLRGHWHPLYESRVNSHSWSSLSIFFHLPFLFSFSFTTFVLL